MNGFDTSVKEYGFQEIKGQLPEEKGPDFSEGDYSGFNKKLFLELLEEKKDKFIPPTPFLDEIINSKKSKYILLQDDFDKTQEKCHHIMAKDLKRFDDNYRTMVSIEESDNFYNTLTKEEKIRYDSFSPEGRESYRQFKFKLKTMDDIVDSINEKAIAIKMQIDSNIERIKKCNSLLV